MSDLKKAATVAWQFPSFNNFLSGWNSEIELPHLVNLFLWNGGSWVNGFGCEPIVCTSTLYTVYSTLNIVISYSEHSTKQVTVYYIIHRIKHFKQFFVLFLTLYFSLSTVKYTM